MDQPYEQQHNMSLNSQSHPLAKVQAHLMHYSHELHSDLSQSPAELQPERDALMAVYHMLLAMHKSMAADLADLEVLLSRTSDPTQLRLAGKQSGMAVVRLSYKEHEVLNIFAKGYSYSESARLLNCKLATIQTHAKRIYKKLCVHSRAEAIFEARQLGIIEG